MGKNSFTKSGIILIDKPAGVSSARVVAQVKRATGAKKVGHTGTLDPFATGLMICCINSGTRLSRFFLESDKTYAAGLLLGVETDTMDCTGETVFERPDAVPADADKERVEEIITSFEGVQDQLPPVYSALKHNGVPLYKLARKGEPVQKPPRRIHIYKSKLEAFHSPKADIVVSCSTGTYIRTLASDIGRTLGCGAHLYSLRRTESGPFSVKDAITPEALAELEKPEERLMPLTDALPWLPSYSANGALEKKISNGMSLSGTDGIQVENNGEIHDFIKILNRQGDLIAIVSPDKTEDKYNYCCVFHY